MTTTELNTIISLTDEIRILKLRHKALSRIVYNRWARVKERLKQLEGPAYEWDFKRKSTEAEV